MNVAYATQCATVRVSASGSLAHCDGLVPLSTTLIADNRPDEARERLERERASASSEHALTTLHTLARRHENDPIAQAAVYNDILRMAPSDATAIRGRVFATLRMGASRLALRYAEEHPNLFSSAELAELRQASAAKSIRWGELEARAGTGPMRMQATDRALSENGEILARHRLAGTTDSPEFVRAQFDRIIGLKNRFQMADAIALYLSVKDSAVPFTPNVLAAVAEAYAYQYQPEQAQALYLQALAMGDKDAQLPIHEWQFGLLEAYLDAGDYKAARRLRERLVKEIPPLLNPGLKGVQRHNEFYDSARVYAARARLAAEDLNGGERLLDTLLTEAPFNSDARLARADLLQARDQPRAALKSFKTILVDTPTSVDAATGIADTALTLHDPATAKFYVDALTRNYPESRAVQRTMRDLENYLSPRLVVTSEFGHSSKSAEVRGKNDRLLDATLYSSPLQDHWRVLVHSFTAQSEFDEGSATRRRIGLGGDYRAAELEVRGELTQRPLHFDEQGYELQTTWHANDHWHWSAEYQTQTNHIPVRASSEGIDATRLAAGFSYTQDESGSLNFNLAYSKFSDQNRRTELGLAWNQRWLSGPVYKLDTRVGMFTSENSIAETNYFNPRRDLSLELGVINEWTLWRRYQRSFKHRLEANLGSYRQQDFGTAFSTGVRYSHEWNWDRYRSLTYGMAYQRQPFDGALENRISAFLNLDWHF